MEQQEALPIFVQLRQQRWETLLHKCDNGTRFRRRESVEVCLWTREGLQIATTERVPPTQLLNLTEEAVESAKVGGEGDECNKLLKNECGGDFRQASVTIWCKHTLHKALKVPKGRDGEEVIKEIGGEGGGRWEGREGKDRRGGRGKIGGEGGER